MSPDTIGPVALAAIVATIFDELGLAWLVGGAVASTILGEPRATEDLDVVADLREEHVAPLVARFAPAFYVPDGLVLQAVRRRTSFNVIHHASVRKVDVFVLRDDPLSRAEMARRRRITVNEDPAVDLWLASPEDVILQKLLWYRNGEGVSDRQWRDVLGVLKVQGERLDLEYVARWAASLEMSGLWDRARRQSGLVNPGR